MGLSKLSQNPNITWDIVKANPDRPWDYSSLSKNPNITWDIVESNLDKLWNYNWLTKNKMSKHPHFQNQQLSYVFKLCI
jgi:hypothetical protein